MKLLLFSDSHGQAEYRSAMVKEAEKEGMPDAVLFAGDAGFSSNLLFEGVPHYFVRGNCDYISIADDEELIPMGSHLVYLTHGHLQRVKKTLDILASAAKSKNAGIAIYGHTHQQGLDLIQGVYCINPGALKNGEYAFLHLNADKSVRPDFRKLNF